MLKYKALNIEKSYLDVLVFSVISVIGQQLYKHLDYDKIFGLILILIVSLMHCFFRGEGIGIYIKIRELEKKHDIIFKTEPLPVK